MQSRGWTFTIFDIDDKNKLSLVTLLNERFRYLIYGFETCPETGREHIQGAIYYDSAKEFTRMRRLLPGVHFEKCRGTAIQNRDYCTKEGEFYEFGEMPQQGRSGDLIQALKKTSQEIVQEHPDIYVKYTRGITKYMEEKVLRSKDSPRNVIIMSGEADLMPFMHENGLQDQPFILIDEWNELIMVEDQQVVILTMPSEADWSKLRYWVMYNQYIMIKNGYTFKKIDPEYFIIFYRGQNEKKQLCAQY